jgi:hypothetical protein
MDGKPRPRHGCQGDPSLIQGLQALLEYAEREAQAAGLRLTAQLIGAAALSVSDAETDSYGDGIARYPPMPRDQLH